MPLISYIIGLGLVYLIGKILLIPIKTIYKLITNGLIGGLTLLFFNLLGGLFGLGLELTALNAIITGFLGVPGVILLLVFKLAQH